MRRAIAWSITVWCAISRLLTTEYYKEANDFLNDKDNFRRYPSHVAYMSRYQDIIYQTIQRIKADKQFYNFYISPMNPVSSYTRKYKEDLEHRAFVNGNKLP